MERDPCVQTLSKMGFQAPLAGFLATVPWRSAEPDTCTLGDAGGFLLLCSSSPQLHWGLHIHAPQRDRSRAAKRTPSAFWPLSHDRSMGLHLQMGSDRGFRGVFQRRKTLQVLLKQHPSVALWGGSLAKGLRMKVSSPRNPAGIQPEHLFSHARDAGTVKSHKPINLMGGTCTVSLTSVHRTHVRVLCQPLEKCQPSTWDTNAAQAGEVQWQRSKSQQKFLIKPVWNVDNGVLGLNFPKDITGNPTQSAPWPLASVVIQREKVVPGIP